MKRSSATIRLVIRRHGSGTSEMVRPARTRTFHTFATAGSETVVLVVSKVSGDDTVAKEVNVGSPVLRPSRRVVPTP
jgi:PKD repeat protein